MAPTLTLITTNLVDTPEQFPQYFESFEPFPTFNLDSDVVNMVGIEPTPPISPTNKSLEAVVQSPGRGPSPQPVHFSVPYTNGKANGNGGNGHRILRSATVGYIAPEFAGKLEQMAQG